MKRRLKLCCVWLSALLCGGAMVAWGFGMAGWGFQLFHLGTGNWAGSADGNRGGFIVRFMLAQPGGENTLSIVAPHPLKLDEVSERFVGLNLLYEDFGQSTHGWFLVLPYWLLILLFAIAPALSLRRQYVQRRDKKVFEEVKRQKLESEGQTRLRG